MGKDRSKKYTQAAIVVRIIDRPNPITCFSGNKSVMLYHSFQVNETENKDPDHI